MSRPDDTADLFGAATAPRDEKRRSAHHRPSPETRALVADLAARGERTAVIAARLAISLPTLRFRYENELGRSRYRPTAELAVQIASLAAEGFEIVDIALKTGLSRQTLFRYYRTQIEAALQRTGR